MQNSIQGEIDKMLREAVFRKMGWEMGIKNSGEKCWISSNQEHCIHAIGNIAMEGEELPPIEEQWEVTAKYLGVWMRHIGWYYQITPWPDTFAWVHGPRTAKDVKVELKKHDIALAACEAFMEVEL